MILRDETFSQGVVVRRATLDSDAGTYTLEVDGRVVETRPLTAAERRRFDPPAPTESQRLDAVEPLVLPPADGTPERANHDSLRDGYAQALADLRQIRDSNGALTLLQASNAVRVLARVCIIMLRLLARRFDGTN